MILQIYTLLHVLISLVAIGSGLVVVAGMLAAKRLDGWTSLFLTSTALTSLTGFFFPFRGITPAIVTGIISMVALAVAIYARYPGGLADGWRKAYAISAVFALYLNVFVLVVQGFQKIPVLQALAPKQDEPPFVVAQLLVLATFVVIGVLAAMRFRIDPVTFNSEVKT